jgi:hypothetical protein
MHTVGKIQSSLTQVQAVRMVTTVLNLKDDVTTTETVQARPFDAHLLLSHARTGN